MSAGRVSSEKLTKLIILLFIGCQRYLLGKCANDISPISKINNSHFESSPISSIFNGSIEAHNTEKKVWGRNGFAEFHRVTRRILRSFELDTHVGVEFEKGPQIFVQKSSKTQVKSCIFEDANFTGSTRFLSREKSRRGIKRRSIKASVEALGSIDVLITRCYGSISPYV